VLEGDAIGDGLTGAACVDGLDPVALVPPDHKLTEMDLDEIVGSITAVYASPLGVESGRPAPPRSGRLWASQAVRSCSPLNHD
jgi:hypothetical protein